jgi:hypothetical protein
MSDNKLTISTIPISKLTVILNDFIAKTVNHLNKLSINVEEKFVNFDSKLNDLEIMTTLLESKLNSLPPEITSSYPQLQQCSLDDVNPVINISQNIQNPSSSVPSVPSSNIPSVPPVPGTVPPVPGTGNVPPVPPIPVPGTVPSVPSVPSVPPIPVPGQVPSVPVPNVNVPVPNLNNPNAPNENNNAEGGETGAEEPRELTPQEEFDKFMEEHNNDTFKNLAKMLKLKIPEMALHQKAKMNGLNMDHVSQLIEIWKKLHPEY